MGLEYKNNSTSTMNIKTVADKYSLVDCCTTVIYTDQLSYMKVTYTDNLHEVVTATVIVL